MERYVNPCRPGFGASCALCCGSHHDVSWGELSCCPYIACDTEGLMGCRAYRSPESLPPEKRAFFSRTCKTFYCQAWDLLTDDEISFAAALTGDWYYYSIFICDIALCKSWHRRYGTATAVPSIERERLLQLLRDQVSEISSSPAGSAD